MWFAIIAVTMSLMIAGIVYLGFHVARFRFIRRISRGKKVWSRLIGLGLIVILLAVLTPAFGFVNAAVVILHLTMAFMLTELGFIIARAIRGKNKSEEQPQKENGAEKKDRIYVAGIIATAVTVVYLAVGVYLNYSVVQTDYTFASDKLKEDVRLAVIADSHVGVTFDGEGFREHLKTIEAQKPDMLLVVGDFVDDDTTKEDMIESCKALGELKLKYGVFYVFGNHDRGYFDSRSYSGESLTEELVSNGVRVLQDEAELLGDNVYVIGRRDRGSRDRVPMEELVAGLDTSKYMIVLDHQPHDYDEEAAAGVNLVLSGHTHGGQMIPITHVGEWIGENALVYGHEHIGNTDFVVTSGISCWSIKFKTGCRSEYVIVDLKAK